MEVLLARVIYLPSALQEEAMKEGLNRRGSSSASSLHEVIFNRQNANTGIKYINNFFILSFLISILILQQSLMA